MADSPYHPLETFTNARAAVQAAKRYERTGDWWCRVRCTGFREFQVEGWRPAGWRPPLKEFTAALKKHVIPAMVAHFKAGLGRNDRIQEVIDRLKEDRRG